MAASVGFFLLSVYVGVRSFQAFTGPDAALVLYFFSASTLALLLGYLGWFYEGQPLRTVRRAHRALADAHAALQTSNRHTERILDRITDGFFRVDHAWRFTDLNPQAESLFKKRKSDLLGCDARAYFSAEGGDQFRDTLRAAALERAPTVFETFSHPLNRWLRVHVYPFAEGLSVYYNDITERKAYEKALLDAREEAEQQAQVKSTLLANMSHEIRTPLTSIIGFAGIMAQDASGDHQEFAQLIEQNGQRLMDTLNSVLDLAQLEHEGVPSPLSRIEVAAEIEQIVRLLQPIAEEAGLYLRVERDAEDTIASLDKHVLNRVLTNLLDNAIKFTDEGGVVVTVNAAEEQVRVQVIDTGIGISPAFLPHVFEEFRQEPTRPARAHEGSGLGLAISKRLVEAMGGVIAVESEKGVGTTFTVWFPRAVPQRDRGGDRENPRAA